MYSLFCDVLCIVCVYMCTELLPLGGYPIAVKYIYIYIYIYIFIGEYRIFADVSVRFCAENYSFVTNFVLDTKKNKHIAVN